MKASSLEIWLIVTATLLMGISACVMICDRLEYLSGYGADRVEKSATIPESLAGIHHEFKRYNDNEEKKKR